MSNASFSIRRASHEDAAVLAELGAATFAQTFGHLYSSRDLQEFLTTSRTERRYAAMLADPHKGIWLADDGARNQVGYVVVGPCKLPVDDIEAAAGEIQELYVLAGHQGQQLGSRLLSVAIGWLEAQGRKPLYLGVWSENFSAQRLYGRFGFARVGEYGFPVGDHIDLEFILKRP